MLKTVADRLMTLSDEGFLTARVGDDEFVVIGRTHARGVSFAETILELVSAPILVDELDIVVTASLGASLARPGSSDRDNPAATAETQMRQATTAMYEAKASGRNRWKLSTATIDDSAITEIRLLGEIRAALADDQFRLEYQPQLDLETERLHGYEALLRWDHPERGVVGPAGFIAVSERSGLISQVGAWACRTAIEQCARLNREPDSRPVRMSINVSARQLGDPRLAEMVGALVRANGLDPALITLEITETGLITDSPRAHRNLELLHEQGVSLAIDDFGTGHAGFAYLKDFPVDELKIDQVVRVRPRCLGRGHGHRHKLHRCRPRPGHARRRRGGRDPRPVGSPHGTRMRHPSGVPLLGAAARRCAAVVHVRALTIAYAVHCRL